MSQFCDWVSSYSTVQVTGPTTAVDVLRITARTKPSGVVFTWNAPYKNVAGVKVADVDTVTNTFLDPIAQGIERMIGSGMVSGAVGSEDTDANGLLIDYIDATVEYDPPDPTLGPFTQVVRVPTGSFDEPSFYNALVAAKIGPAYDALKHMAEA